MEESLLFVESGASRCDDGYVRSAACSGRLGGIVRNTGGGAVGAVGLQNDRRGRRGVSESPLWLRPNHRDGSGDRRLRRGDSNCEYRKLSTCQRSTTSKNRKRLRHRCSFSTACWRPASRC